MGEKMSQFNNVTIIKAANVYSDGKVSSRTVQFADGSHKTLGLMLPGEYEFGTQEKELMEILSGELQIMLPGSHTWQNIKGPQCFEVPANAKFQVKASTIVDYCCSYFD
jgi:purine/pyrimidine-nucleoside phosphorylase